MFNKYQFIDELKETVKNEISNITDLDDFIHEIIDNECIYYSDCFDIIKALSFTDFNHEIYGICDTVDKAAFCALYDLIYDESDIFNYYESLTEEA